MPLVILCHSTSWLFLLECLSDSTLLTTTSCQTKHTLPFELSGQILIVLYLCERKVQGLKPAVTHYNEQLYPAGLHTLLSFSPNRLLIKTQYRWYKGIILKLIQELLDNAEYRRVYTSEMFSVRTDLVYYWSQTPNGRGFISPRLVLTLNGIE